MFEKFIPTSCFKGFVPDAGGPHEGAGGAGHAHQLQPDPPQGPLCCHPAPGAPADKLD